MELDIDIDGWPSGDWAALAGRARSATAQVEPAIGNPRLSTSLLFTSDEEVHALNREWRGKDKPTNVLSFPAIEGADNMLGDIALAWGVVEREAADKGISVADHATHLIVHGTFHLLGYDHMDDNEAEAMEALEITALASLGLADPYGDREEI